MTEQRSKTIVPACHVYIISDECHVPGFIAVGRGSDLADDTDSDKVFVGCLTWCVCQ